MKYLIILLFSSSVFAWVTPAEQNVKNKVESHIGHSIDDVIEIAGPPTQITSLHDGKRLYSWHRTGGMTEEVTQHHKVTEVTDSEIYCDTRYTVDKKGIVRKGVFEGSCY
jgi:hypothetical protein